MDRIPAMIMRFFWGALLIFYQLVLMVAVGIFYLLGYTDYNNIAEMAKDIMQGYPCTQEEIPNF